MEHLQQSNKYRNERKYLVEHREHDDLVTSLNLHPCGLQVHYPSRAINNIYFDTPNYQFLSDNVVGAADRLKVRVRWYGESGMHDPILELKIKKGLVNTKESFPLKGDWSKPELEWPKIWVESGIPESYQELLLTLSPVLKNSYQRDYFIDVTHQFRVTLDHALEFQTLNEGFSENDKLENVCIIELKYAPKNEKGAKHISSFFPFRLTKSSKYVMGLTIFSHDTQRAF